jgi:ribosome-binding protein aMBF1 (putative translation factor)
VAKTRRPHDAALASLVPSEERADYERRVKALVARNKLLSTLESVREAEKLSKKDLAKRAGLDASSVRRMLTAETANPTTENAFLLLSAMDIKLQAVLPSGSRVDIV